MDNVTCGEFSKKELNAICSLAIIKIIFYITYGSIPTILTLTKKNNEVSPNVKSCRQSSEARKSNNFDNPLKKISLKIQPEIKELDLKYFC